MVEVTVYSHCTDSSGHERLHPESQCRVHQWMRGDDGPNQYVRVEDYRAALAASPTPQQEARAVLFVSQSTLDAVSLAGSGDRNGSVEVWLRPNGERTIPLYTTPQPAGQAAVTDEDAAIAQAWDEARNSGTNWHLHTAEDFIENVMQRARALSASLAGGGHGA